MYGFFAYLNRLKYIERWSLMHSSDKENVAEHSLAVAMIAHCLGVVNNLIYHGNVDAQRLTVAAMYHESAEVITGDLPTPIKYFNPAIKTAYKDLEAVACDKLVAMLPTELQTYYGNVLRGELLEQEKKLLKAADKLAAYVKCLEELKSGNKEFTKAKLSISKELKQFDSPEVAYFTEHFLEAYGKTLDELSVLD